VILYLGSKIMRIPRIYLPMPLSAGSEVALDDNALRHAVQVLRLKSGHELILFNGEGGEYHAQLSRVERRRAQAQVLSFHATNRESRLETHLALGISKGERMDMALQKSVELGVHDITPLYTEHCVVQLSDSREQKRLDHWQAIIISACEQCGRNILPRLHAPLTLEAFSAREYPQQRFILDPLAQKSLCAYAAPGNGVLLCIGPEGGFSEQELAHCQQQGFQGVQLGPRILRTETAVITALGAVQTLWGDLAGMG